MIALTWKPFRKAERAAKPGIEEVIASLEQLNRATEESFLAVGAKIGEFQEVADRISSDVSELVGAVSDDRGEAGSRALMSALEDSQALLAKAETTGATLEALRKAAREIRSSLVGFESVIASFRSVGALTRIETARLNGSQEDFGNLAEAVRTLTESIQARVGQSLESAAALEADVQSALRNISELDGRQMEELPSLIVGLTSDIVRFRAAQQHGRDAMAQLAARYQELSGTIRNLSMSIQFEDITRQQVEQVIWKLAGPAGGGGNAESQAVIARQVSQLSKTALTFAAAVSKVDRELADIGEQIVTMAGESGTLLGSSEEEQNTFFLEMEGRFTAVLRRLETCGGLDRDAGAAISGLGQALDRLRVSINDIQNVEIQMERLALNATIRATHIGRAGDALNVVAEAMHCHALECAALSGKTVAALEFMRSAVERAPGEAKTGDSEAIKELPPLIKAMHSASERTFSRITEVATLAQRLSENIEHTRKSFNAGALFRETTDRCIGGLADRVPDWATRCSIEPDADAAPSSNDDAGAVELF